MNSFHLLNNQYLADCANCPLNGSKPVFSYFLDLDASEVSNIDVLVLGQCYSADTEILTDRGWKLFYNLDDNDRICTLNSKSNVIEYQVSRQYFCFDYVGELYNFKNTRLDLLVTPNHNMIVDRRAFKSQDIQEKRLFVQAKDFNKNLYRIPRTGKWEGKFIAKFEIPKSTWRRLCFGQHEYFSVMQSKIVDMNDWLAFFGFWLAEGWTYKRINKKGSTAYYIGIGQKPGNIIDEFELIVKKLGFNYIKKIDRNGFVRLIIVNKQLYEYLIQFGKCTNKFIPSYIKELCSDQLLILFNWLMRGDGNVNKGSLFYTTTSKQLADDIQELALKIGYAANIYCRKRKNTWNVIYNVSILTKLTHSSFRNAIDKIYYHGKVYCVEVPNHIIYVRRNGKACWCGNSPGQSEVELGRPFIGKSGKLINPIIEKYSHKIGYVNMLSCRPIADQMPETLELKCCRDRMLEDVKFAVSSLKPKIILVLGGIAKKQLRFLQKNCSELNDILIYQFEHPAYILRNDHLMPQYISSLHSALKSAFQENSKISENFIFYNEKYKFQFINDYTNTNVIGVDIETNKLNIFAEDFKIGTIAISCEKNTYFFDCRSVDFRKNEILMEFLTKSQNQKVFADVLFDVVAFKRFGIEILNITDLFPVAFLYDNTHREYNLEAICLRYRPEFSAYKSKFKSILIDNNYLTADTTALFQYNCTDAFVTKTLYEELYAKLDVGTKRIYDIIYRNLLRILVNIKSIGLRVDVNLLNEYKIIYENRFVQIAEIFKNKFGITNINSTPQIRQWMFSTLKLKSIRKTDSDADSTDKKTIEFYATRVPEMKLLLEARVISSRLNYFLPAIYDNLDVHSLIHPNYKHYGIQSGRIACKSPNLQGIPRDETGMKSLDETSLRKVFIARCNDSYIIEFDYSQQEVRIVAFLAQDLNMIQTFNDKKDIHRYVASIIFNKNYDVISKFERQVAKGCVFGAIFGVSARELAISLRIDERKAQAYIDKFFQEFPKIKFYIDRQGDLALRNKKVVSILGMPRSFIVNKRTESEVRREGPNHLIQSVGAAFTFLSLIKIHKFLENIGLLNSEVFIIHTVHDSIMLDVKREHLQFVVDKVIEIMQDVPKSCKFIIDYPVEYKIGKTWGEELNLEEILNESLKEMNL